MKFRQLGRTGFSVSEIGYGAWGIGGKQWLGGSDDETTFRRSGTGARGEGRGAGRRIERHFRFPLSTSPHRNPGHGATFSAFTLERAGIAGGWADGGP